MNDIGYFPRVRDGKQGFAVHAGGGLGSQPFLARPIRDFLPVEDTLIMAEAIVRLQHRSGERKNRKKARMKYLFQQLGAERFIAEVDQLFAQVEREQGAALRAELKEMVCRLPREPSPRRPPSPLPEPADRDFAHWVRTNVFAQKQTGYYGATVQLPLGDITSRAAPRPRHAGSRARSGRAACGQRPEPHGAVDSRQPSDGVLPALARDRSGRLPTRCTSPTSPRAPAPTTAASR